MYTIEDFEKAYKLFTREFRSKPKLFVKNIDNNHDYLITGVTEKAVTSLHGNTPKSHIRGQLRNLFMIGRFKAPNSDRIYTLNSRDGDLPIKIAIVSHLKQLLRRAPD